MAPPDPSTMNPSGPAVAAGTPGETGGDEGDGYTLCIDVKPDGTFHVAKEPLEGPGEEAAEGQPGGEGGTPTPPMDGSGGEEEGEDVDTFEDALKCALRLYRDNPISNNPEAQFTAGYGKPPASAS